MFTSSQFIQFPKRTSFFKWTYPRTIVTSSSTRGNILFFKLPRYICVSVPVCAGLWRKNYKLLVISCSKILTYLPATTKISVILFTLSSLGIANKMTEKHKARKSTKLLAVTMICGRSKYCQVRNKNLHAICKKLLLYENI